ncbi:MULTISPECIES: hypothetical protein [Microbacterium]|uniref:Cell division protein FtsL n=1 Tax=Microbacterium barkeri TaxID=33917 RepID=A0A9W6H2Y2_9MICO|nr:MULTISPECIES: hypothetical protein [Microbacterium]MDR6875591.1 cell division protein FtsB [Microbacterium barkeri]WRH17844.1 hypothetical protein GC092_10190 [Microbacterium sp. JZ37]GLJ61560.1 hypothetical protein GCM10017576_16900 [Microbacterium barkeri]
MSLATQSSVLAPPARRPVEKRRPDLRPVEAPARRRRPKLAYAVVAVVGAVLIAVAQMALSVMTTQSTFEIAALDAQQRELTLETQALYDEVAGLSSPQHLAEQAASLGMVIDAAPSYLRLSDGAVIGGGAAAGSASAVDAAGRGAVGNAFLADTQSGSAEESADEAPSSQTEKSDERAQEEQPQLPPAVTDGLPSPTTH